MAAEKYMLIIGIDDYRTASFKPLNNAVEDAYRFKKVMFERYGFITLKELYNEDATRDKIHDALDDLSVQLREEDILVIYFAGHGFLQDPTDADSQGYWVPCRIQEERTGRYVPNAYILDAIRRIKAKHVLLISDSCYSGSLVRKTLPGSSITDLEELENLSSRWAFVSGGIEKVSDGKGNEGSPFGKSCREYLELNEAPAFKAADFFDHVIDTVRKNGYSQQVQAHPLSLDEHQGGQMIFRLVEQGSQLALIEQKKEIPLPEVLTLEYYIPRSVSNMDPTERGNIFFGQEQRRSTLASLVPQHRRIVLLGGAGSGKSIELYKMAQVMQEPDNPFVPVYQRLNTYVNQNIESFLPFGWQKLNHDRTVLLLDGLDEVPPHHFNTAIRKITHFAKNYPRLRIIVSCRTNFFELPEDSFQGSLEGFKIFQINDISITEIKAYVADHFGMDGEDFIQEVFNQSLLDLVQKPFFLNVLVKHYRDNGRLTAGRTKILEEALLAQFNENKKHYLTTTTHPLERRDIFRLLEKVAFVMEMMGRNYLTEEEIADLFPEKEDYESLDFLPAFNNDKATHRWMFEHNNLQEYLAARVLNRVPLEELKVILIIPGTSTIKPHWANTLSFYISIGEPENISELLEWLLSDNREMVVKFERERVPEKSRVEVVKRIIDYFNDEQIWISASNKFSVKDLGYFGSVPEVIEYILDILSRPQETEVTRLNMIYLLDFLDPQILRPFAAKTRAVLMAQLDWDEADHNLIHAVLHSMGSLGLGGTPIELESLVNRYRRHTNEHIRAGLYKLITNAKAVNEYLDVFLDGLNLTGIKNAIEGRSEVTLMDEGHWLTEGLKQVSSLEGIKRVIGSFENPYTRREHIHDPADVFEDIVRTVLRNHPTESSLFAPFLKLFKSAALKQDDDLALVLANYFKGTGARWTAFLDIWQDSELAPYEKVNLLTVLVDENCIDRALLEHKEGRCSDEQLSELKDVLAGRADRMAMMPSSLEKMEAALKNVSTGPDSLSQQPNWPVIHQQWNQESFDLLFDINKIIYHIDNIFKTLGTDTITAEQVRDLQMANNRPEGHIPYEVLRYLSSIIIPSQPVNRQTVIGTLQGPGFDYYRGIEIYRYLQPGRTSQVKVSPSQEDFIAEWCTRMSENTDLGRRIRTGDDLVSVIWNFLLRTKTLLPTDKLQDFTLYYDFSTQGHFEDPGVVDQLEKFLAPKLIRDRVKENLERADISSLSWLNNAAYAVRHKVTEVAPLLERYLLSARRPDKKMEDFLEFYLLTTDDEHLLYAIVERAESISMRQSAIRILLKADKGQAFLEKCLSEVSFNEQEPIEFRLYAANILMSFGHTSGLEFAAEHILQEADPHADYGHMINQAYHLKDVKAIPTLMRLLLLSRQPAFQTRINFFESEIHKALFNIGIQSMENCAAVKEAYEQFIRDHKQDIPDLNFLKVNILRLEQQVILQHAKGETFQQAVSVFENLTLGKRRISFVKDAQND